MEQDGDGLRSDLAAIEACCALLEQRLARIERGWALIRLVGDTKRMERASNDDVAPFIDALGQAAPIGRAYVELVRSKRDVLKRVHRTAHEADPADQPLAPKPRLKVKAASIELTPLTMAERGAAPLGPSEEPPPPPATPLPEKPRRDEISRIRLLDAVMLATDAAERSRERRGSSLRLAAEFAPSASTGSSPATDPETVLAVDKRAVPVAGLPALAGAQTIDAIATRASPEAARSAEFATIDALRPPAASTPPLAPLDRIGALEAEMERLLPSRTAVTPSAAQVGRRKQLVEEDAPAVEVDEAQVEIVLHTRNGVPCPTPLPEVQQRAIPLATRLKQHEHEIEFDADSYAAYYEDVAEASVQIMRPGAEIEAVAVEVPPEAGIRSDRNAGRARRFLKAITGE